MKSTDLLAQEHKLILRALDVLDGITAVIEQRGTLDSGDTARILDFLRWFADAHHQAKEETILFPALKAGADFARSVQHMMFEHDKERHSIEDLEKGVRLGKLSDFAFCANQLGSELRNHIYKEDHFLFPAAVSLLTQQQDEIIFDQLSRFDTEFDKQVLNQKLGDLHSLEWKYLRK